MNERDLRDCFAMFALAGLLMRGNNKLENIAEGAYVIADEMLQIREEEVRQEAEGGIASVKPKRRYTKKNYA